MAETGVLDPDARVELLNGEIIDMSPIGPFHGGIVKRLNRIFSNTSDGRWIVSVQDPILLAADSEPEPDLALLKPSSDQYISRHPGPNDVLLLIEVVDSPLEVDRGVKLPAYAKAGIPEVWIVNLLESVIEVHREPSHEGYALKSVSRAGDSVAPIAFPDAEVEVGELLKR